MGTAHYQFVCKERTTQGPMIKQLCNGETPLEVRDLTTQSTLQVLPGNVSVFRHCLMIDSRQYDILTVKQLA